jgi:hypothetical protein
LTNGREGYELEVAMTDDLVKKPRTNAVLGGTA